MISHDFYWLIILLKRFQITFDPLTTLRFLVIGMSSNIYLTISSSLHSKRSSRSSRWSHQKYQPRSTPVPYNVQQFQKSFCFPVIEVQKQFVRQCKHKATEKWIDGVDCTPYGVFDCLKYLFVVTCGHGVILELQKTRWKIVKFARTSQLDMKVVFLFLLMHCDKNGDQNRREWSN